MKPKFLEQIGRGQLGRLLEKFQPDFTANNITLPPPTLEDGEYYAALGNLSISGPGLPDAFCEVLHSVEALANTAGKGRLLRGLERAGEPADPNQQVSEADFAVQVFLTHPAVFKEANDENRIAALSSFEYFGCAEPVDRRLTFVMPDAASVARIKRDFDDWLAEQREGAERATQIEVHEIAGEFWVLIRRGDTLTRVPVLEGQQFLVRQLRPARDLVAVYTPERDDLRIFGKSAREKNKLRQIIGERLFGEPENFSVRNTFTLAPLWDDGVEALIPPPDIGIDRIVLRQWEERLDDENDTVIITKANDLFAAAPGARLEVPTRGRLVSAGFEVFFIGHEKSRMVYLEAGNKLRLTRYCDGLAVHRWLTAKGFRSVEEPGVNRLRAFNGNTLANN